jgi:hypothetical protein
MAAGSNMNPHFTEPPVLAALIAAFSALVLGLFQFFTQRRQSASIEQLKARLAQQSATEAKYLETYLNLVVEGRQQQAHAYGSLLQAIQLLRDKIRHFLMQPESYHPNVMCQEISEQSDAIVTIYSANQLQLGEAGRSQAHLVKDIARNLAIELEHIRRLNSESKTREQLQNLKYTEERLAPLAFDIDFRLFS